LAELFEARSPIDWAAITPTDRVPQGPPHNLLS